MSYSHPVREVTIVTPRIAALVLPLVGLFAVPVGAQDIPNPLIDYDSFADNVQLVREYRKHRRISERDFIRMARDPGTVVLDARSEAKYRLLHIKGAVNLSLPDITAAELARIIPDKNTRVLIYCNNNFENEQQAFPTKVLPASLNVYTFNVLYSYGYTNVYELGPLIDIRRARLKFEGSRAAIITANNSP
jgi:hypothetical protein